MKRLSPSSLPRRVRKFYRNSQSQKIIAELLKKVKDFCQSKIQWLINLIYSVISNNYPVIFSLLLLGILIKFPLTSLPWLASAILDADPDSLKSWGFYLLGAGIAPLGLCLTYNRTQSLRMQTDTNIFTKSIELLADPNPAVRQGGIYSLGGIARDNHRLHPTIMKIMTSYVREKTYEKFNERTRQEKSQKNKREELFRKLSKESSMPSDIEAAIEVIRERKINSDQPLKGSKKFDLSNSYVFNADFSFTKFFKTNFSDSIMLECCFDETDLSGSSFVSSNLQESSFINATLKNCEFIKTNLQGCNFKECDLSGSEFEKCDLSGSEFEKCDLRNVKKLTQEQINKAKVDEATKLPRAINRPKGTTTTGNSTT